MDHELADLIAEGVRIGLHRWRAEVVQDRAWRPPMSEEEALQYVTVIDEMAIRVPEGWDPWEGITR